ncbi:helix-turn-helix domain-containing protein [Alkalihalophilus sp. As8PL]|uniref:Helix-turn-helix domain-containing protein n=1 Tax=Alkalihalophilus sp. As8PL TaxID=3237103 RepID=A0AB39BUW3_9BACI
MNDVIILAVCKAFKGERTIYGAYHLLQGKKSAQTIQDGHFFSVLSYFGLFPTMKRNDMTKIVKFLTTEGYLQEIGEDRYLITEKGEKKRTLAIEETPLLLQLNGWLYGKLSLVFWQRLTLWIQTITHIQSGKKSFIPIIQDRFVQAWVRHVLPKNHQTRDKALSNLHQELQALLIRYEPQYALFFVLQLTTDKKIGYTARQAAHICSITEKDAVIIQQALLHDLLKEIEARYRDFPILFRFIDQLEKGSGWTRSADQTSQLLEQGLTIKEIATIRKLKTSTIEDHIIELALQKPTFPVHDYISMELQEKIEALIQSKGELVKLRELKDALGDEASYFMIRLALTRRKG